MTRIKNSLSRIPLILKTVSLTLFVGVLIWAGLDYFVNKTVASIFEEQLTERLNRQASSYRYRFGRYMYSYNNLAKLVAPQKGIIEYVSKQQWSDKDTIEVKYHRRKPEWFPGLSSLRAMVIPRYAILIDNNGNAREAYQIKQQPPPQLLLKPSANLLRRTEGVSYLTSINGLPYLVTTEPVVDYLGSTIAILMLASPIDADFMLASQGRHTEGLIIALVTRDENRVIVSSNLSVLPVGSSIESMYGQHIAIRQTFYEYGDSDMNFKFVSLVPKDELTALTATLVSNVRKYRSIIAIVFILSFTVISYYISRRIVLVTRRVTDFSRKLTGDENENILKGDQLDILEEQFKQLTFKVITANAFIVREAEERNRVIVNNAFDAIITVDENDSILTWNPRAEDIFGYSREEVLGRKIYEMIIPLKQHELQGNSIKDYFQRMEGDEVDLRMAVETIAYNRNGHEFPVELSISPVTGADASIYICNIRDITSRKQSERELAAYHEKLETMVSERTGELEAAHEELLKSEKLSVLGRLTAIVSHELRNPLGVIRNSAFYLQSKVDKSDEKAAKHLKRIDNQVVLCDSIIGDLLEYTRGRLTEAFPGDINLWLNDIIKKINIPEDVAVVFEPGSDLPKIHFDREKLRRALFNLADNSVMALNNRQDTMNVEAGYHPQLKFITLVSGDAVHIIVEDNGIGMDEETASHAFEPLFTTRARGTGLGLAIVKKTIEDLDGSVFMDTKPDHGTKITLAFPVIHENEQ